MIPCPFSLAISVDEEEGLEWLQTTLEKIINKPDHKNHDKAEAAYILISRVYEHMDYLHERLHHADRTLSAMTSLKVQGRGEA